MRIQTLIAFLIPFILCAGVANANQQLAADFCTPIGEIIPGTVVDIGAACGNSWRGSNQYIQNMQQFAAPPPAESTVDSSCGLVLGASDLVFNQRDPDFVGWPGHKGSHYVFDGTNFLAWPDTGSPLNDAMGKTTGFKDFTMALVITPVPNGTLQAILSTKAPGCAAGNYRGVYLWIDTGNHVNFSQCGDHGPESQVTSAVTLQPGLTYFIAVGRSGATTDLWVGSTTAESFTQTYGTTALGPSSKMAIGAMPGSSSYFLAPGTEIYDFQTFNRLLTDSDITTDIGLLETRDGISPFTH